jgi:hypothetical protein
LIIVEWIRFFKRRLVPHQVQAKAGELAHLPHPRIGKPDRRHQVALGERREDERVGLVGLAGQRSESLDPVRGGDLDRPALPFERVVDEPGAVIDSTTAQTGSPCTSSMRRASLLRESRSGGTASWSRCLPSLIQETDVELLATEIESSVQHVERVLLGARFPVNTASVSPAGDPSSWQSGAVTRRVVRSVIAFRRKRSSARDRVATLSCCNFAAATAPF